MRGLLIAFAFIVVAVAAGSCKRPCDTARNCIRTCECVNENTNQQLDCSVGFRCEGDTSTCEDLHDTQSCDDVCNEYAARARCGVFRCLEDAECTRVLSCPLADANGAPNGQFAECTVGFACEQDFGSCEPASSLSDEVLCAQACFR